MPLDQAMRETAAARERLTGVYGRVPAVVLFTQREEDGPVRIGRALRVVSAVDRLHRDAPGPVLVRAVVPGGQALEHWFRRRWADVASPPASVVEDAREFGDLQAALCRGGVDLQLATVTALRSHDGVLADAERMHRNGVPLATIASHVGKTEGEFRAMLEQMRALGLDVPHRRSYASKRSATRRASPR